VTVREALERERKLEQEFVETARASERSPKGWPASLVMFHIGMWRERMRDALAAASEGREYHLPGTRDEINDAELADGIGTPLADAAARSDLLLSEIAELLEKVGDRPIQWFAAVSATQAVLRNSFSHPRVHICEYLAENGDAAQARRIVEDGLGSLREISAPEYVTGILTELRDGPRLR
jgi:hypothetical protein